MTSDQRVYVENDCIVFEKTFKWEYILSIARKEEIPLNKLTVDKVSQMLMEYLPENIDIDELFSEYLESLSEEK